MCARAQHVQFKNTISPTHPPARTCGYCTSILAFAQMLNCCGLYITTTTTPLHTPHSPLSLLDLLVLFTWIPLYNLIVKHEGLCFKFLSSSSEVPLKLHGSHQRHLWFLFFSSFCSKVTLTTTDLSLYQALYVSQFCSAHRPPQSYPTAPTTPFSVNEKVL